MFLVLSRMISKETVVRDAWALAATLAGFGGESGAQAPAPPSADVRTAGGGRHDERPAIPGTFRSLEPVVLCR